MKSEVSVCIIVRNEPLLEKSILSIRDYVKEIVIVDTGSTDGTDDIARKYADIFESYTGCNDPQSGLIDDFSNARQRSFDLATQPWVMWMDADDFIDGAERIESVIRSADAFKDNFEAVCFMFPYQYAYNQYGECTCTHYRERLLSNKECFKWVNPVHEVLIPKDGKNVLITPREEIIYKHQRQYSNKPAESGRNLRILKKYVEKVGDSDARQLYYLGLEYFNARDFDESIKCLTKYIAITGWDDECCMACLKMVEICELRGNYTEGLKWAFKAVETKESWSEGYLALSRMFYYIANQNGPNAQRNWEKCAFFAKTGLAMPPTRTLLFVNPQEREHLIHLFYNIALNKLGDVEGALASVNKGLEKQPNDGMLLANKRLYENHLAVQQSSAAIQTLTRNGHFDELTNKALIAMLNKETVVPHNVSPENMAPTGNCPFPIAKNTSNAEDWTIPNSWTFDGYPVQMTDEQLQSVVMLVWKQYMLHDEVLSAISFLENAPYNVRHSFVTQQALKLTKDCLVWMDNKDEFQTLNANGNIGVEAGNPIPVELVWQEGNRFDLIKDNLPPGTIFVDFGSKDGCFTNRLGMLGHNPTGLDACESSVKLANKKAIEFNTGAEHICTYFQNSIGKVAEDHFEYATSADTYEHLKDPINDMLIPAKKMLKADGKFLLVTPHGSWTRGQYFEWAIPWNWAREGKSWLHPEPRPHLIAPTVWSVAEHFRQAGYWVKDSYVSLCSPNKDVEGQGNIFSEAHIKTPQNDNKLDIVFFIGQGVEEWTPISVKKGGPSGGSELMAIEMSKRLAGLGHKVRIYAGSDPVNEGIYDGVEYRTTNKYQDLKCDVLIVSRRANMLGDQYNISARIKLLWIHDIYAISATNELLLKADKILVLSEWHKQNVINAHNVHEAHVIVTRNGIDLTRFTMKNIARDKFKCICTSSPDRYLPILLDIWPKIKEKVPEATLTIGYGFHNWEFSAKFDQLQMDLINRLKDQIKNMESLGVIFKNRMTQNELSEELLSSSVWLFSTWFSETSCISGMEMQAAGVKMITSNIAALKETVGNRGVLIDGDWVSEEYQNKFIEHTVMALKDEDNIDRQELQQYAKDHFCLDKLAQEWEQMFYQLIKQKKSNPVIPYQPTTPYRGDGKGYSDGDTRLDDADPRRNKLKVGATSKSKPTISIMVPTMRIGGLDILCESLKKQTFKNFELVIVDGIYKYRKDTVEAMKVNYDFPIKHVEPTKNTFPVGCCCNSSNTGIINASGELLLIITDYTYLPADCVAKHVSFHKDNPAENLGYMCPHQYKTLPELNPDFIPYDKPLEDAVRYSEDLAAGKLNHVLWSILKEPFNQDPELLPLDSMGNADTKLFMTFGPGDQNAFNGKNESMKISAALKVNGYDEDLDGTHCWQDNVFSDMLVRILGFTWIVDPINKVYIINPRFVTPHSKRIRHYETNKPIWDRKRAENYTKSMNDWSLRGTRNNILELIENE